MMRQVRALMARHDDAQARLDGFVRVVASSLIADVCSVYLRRPSGALELCATQGLAGDAVHATRLRPGEGLVGVVAREARPLNLRDAPAHPGFSFRSETGEEGVVSFLGVPILRGGRLLGVLTIQNRTPRRYDEEEVEALQTAAMVLAEVVVDPTLERGAAFEELELRPVRPERLNGRRIAEGLAIGPALVHQMHVAPDDIIAERPEEEVERIQAAVAALRASVDALLETRVAPLDSQPREVLEAYRMIAHDRGWLSRLVEAARSGLTAEAAVERVRNEHRARMMQARDPYLRDRLHDLEDLANRLMRHLANPEEVNGAVTPGLANAKGAVVFARVVGPAELLEYATAGVAGVVLEEGAAASHAAIVARAMSVPMIGRVSGVLDRVEDGDTVIVDGGRAEVHLRPAGDVLDAYRDKIALRGQAVEAFRQIKDTPAVTTDGARIHLYLNAGLLVDLPQIAATGVEGVGLFRTEFQFMVANTLPRQGEQTALYAAALDAAGGLPVTFRTLDLGGDKLLTYAEHDREENPAMGWRALRMALDRPGLMRYQLRALLTAAAGRELRVMFPLVATTEEFRTAKDLLISERDRRAQRGHAVPTTIHVGAMIETPALLFQLDALLPLTDFVSVGLNDLRQFMFAADRGNPRLADRYDVLSPPILAALARIQEGCARHGVPASICGEAAGRPIEAMTLIALGFDALSMPAPGVGPVKRMILGLNRAEAAARIAPLATSAEASVRSQIKAIAKEIGAPLA